MHKIALVLASLACGGHGRRLQASDDLPPSDGLAEHANSVNADLNSHLFADASHPRSNERLAAKETFSALKALSMLLLDGNPAAAFHSLHPGMRSASGNPTSVKAHSLDASDRAVSPDMKWDVDVMPWMVEYGKQSAPVELPSGVVEGGPPAPFEITDEQRQRLEEDGAVHIKGFLSDEWLQYLRDATDWQVENPHFWSIAGVASGLYDYIQRSVWASNDAYANFLYYSPLASALAGLGNAQELRLATDLLMVNPNKGFKWHQDNQNGPIDAFKDGVALRWWVTMDDCPPDHGAPVYLKGSHRNTEVSEDAVFVDLEKDGLLKYPEMLEFKPKAGDLIVWHPRSIHKIDGPKSQDWEKSKRRVFGGTVALDDAKYLSMGRALFSDMGSHGLEEGQSLRHPLFPKIYPVSDPVERTERASGRCTRTWEGAQRLAGNMFANIGEMVSWTKVVNPEEKAKTGSK